jgi:hypothetical protein
MVRSCALAAVAAGAAFVTGASVPPRPAAAPPPDARPVAVGQKVGFFSMPRVMRDYRRAKARVDGLNAERARLSAGLVVLRAMYAALTDRPRPPAPPGPPADAPDTLALARLIEDTDRAITRALERRATAVIAELHDELHAAAAEAAREHRLTALLAFPDAPEEAESPAVKELRLKPPAAYPFFLDPAADYTDDLVRRVNARFPAAN